MEATGDFHHEVADTTLMEPDALLNHTRTLHTTDAVLDANSSRCVGLICRLLLLGQGATTGLLEGLKYLNPIECEGQKAEVLEEVTPFG